MVGGYIDFLMSVAVNFGYDVGLVDDVVVALVVFRMSLDSDVVTTAVTTAAAAALARAAAERSAQTGDAAKFGEEGIAVTSGIGIVMVTRTRSAAAGAT